VKHKDTGLLSFHVWYPGCPMEEDAFGILKPKDTAQFEPELLLVPCLGYGAGGLRVGYGGGFVERTLRALHPPPVTVGLGYSVSWVPGLQALSDDRPLDAILTDDGAVWPPAG
jgi:5,10-methenyltetrahydrofolate synthetase